jgi:hypothetical protein
MRTIPRKYLLYLVAVLAAVCIFMNASPKPPTGAIRTIELLGNRTIIMPSTPVGTAEEVSIISQQCGVDVRIIDKSNASTLPTAPRSKLTFWPAIGEICVLQNWYPIYSDEKFKLHRAIGVPLGYTEVGKGVAILVVHFTPASEKPPGGYWATLHYHPWELLAPVLGHVRFVGEDGVTSDAEVFQNSRDAGSDRWTLVPKDGHIAAPRRVDCTLTAGIPRSLVEASLPIGKAFKSRDKDIEIASSGLRSDDGSAMREEFTMSWTSGISAADEIRVLDILRRDREGISIPTADASWARATLDTARWFNPENLSVLDGNGDRAGGVGIAVEERTMSQIKVIVTGNQDALLGSQCRIIMGPGQTEEFKVSVTTREVNAKVSKSTWH